MTRINTNLSSIVGRTILGRNQQSLQTSLTRLSTGLRINSGKDDPAGLIASEVLRQELTSISASISNTERANNIVSTVDAALKEVSSRLNDIRGLVQSSANKGAISSSEIASNQVQLDSALDAISRIAQTTVFGGEKLLNGSKSFVITGASLDPFQSSSDITVKAFNPALHTSTANDDVTINVTRAATHKTVEFAGTAAGANNDLNDLTAGGTTTLELVGDKGRSVITIDNDAVIADTQAFVDAVNAVTTTTGITASKAATADGNVTLTSEKFGAGAIVTVNVIAGHADDVTAIGAAQTATNGLDAAGTVTHALGSGAFSAVGELITFTDANLTVSGTTDPALGTGTASFDVTGGALFQLGPSVDYANQVNINIAALDLATLGRNFTTTAGKAMSNLRSGGSDQLSSDDLSDAAKVVEQAIEQIATLRGSLGALQKNAFESNINSLENSFEQVTAARSSIVDADFATETANLTRQQILVQAGTSVLAIANSSPQQILALLGR